MVIKIFMQAEVAKDILSIESVSVIGLMLLIIIGLVYHIKAMEKKHDAERAELKQDVKDVQDKLDKEYATGTNEMKVIIEKYYTITTKFLEKINTIIN